MSVGQKRARLENVYLPSDWTSDTKILITGWAGGDILAHKRILKNRIFD